MELTSFVDMLEDISDDIESLVEVIGLCGSFLTLRERTIYFIHQSAKDFLLREAYGQLFPLGIEEKHYAVFKRSLSVMSGTLRRDIYNLCAPGFPIHQLNQPDPDPLAAARYSCAYWFDHIEHDHDGDVRDGDSSSQYRDELRDGGTVHRFLQEKFLYWLEALSLMRSMSKGVFGISKLVSLLTVSLDFNDALAFGNSTNMLEASRLNVNCLT
jgi:hypothetical protein